jgi:hypothetical protein
LSNTERTHSDERLRAGHSIAGSITVWVIGVCTAVGLAVQGLSLYSLPLPDSALYWYGDESWLMLEARTQIMEGIARHPFALGATLSHHIGILLGNTWITSALYGIPATIFATSFPIILIGRTVTFVLAIGLLVFLYFALKRVSVHREIAAITLILLSTCSAFVYSSHSARPDLLIGFVVLIIVSIFATYAKDHVIPEDNLWWFGFGSLMTFAAMTVSIHLVTLLFPLAVFLMIRFGAFRNLGRAAVAILGALIALTGFIIIYRITTGDVSLFGTSGQHIQFIEVAKEKPILRPFSRSVQLNNLFQRLDLLWKGVPVLLIAMVLTVAQLLLNRFKTRKNFQMHRAEKFSLAALVIVFFSWLLLQTSLTYYVPHFIPLLAFVLGVFLQKAQGHEHHRNMTPLRVVLMIVAISLTTFQIVEMLGAKETATELASENLRGKEKMIASLKRIAEQEHITKPLVLIESPAAFGLELDTSIRLMSTLFTAFPERAEPIMTTVRREHVHFALFYDTPLEQENRQVHDPLFVAVASNSTLVDSAVGTFFDMGRSYEHPDFSIKDTLKLFKIVYP